MTVFEELTKGMKFSEPVVDIQKNKEFISCESCWYGYINSEAE